jgi:RNA polymerase sigma factor (sigma-70 family)
VESNLRLVVAIARRYRGLGIDLLDLIQEGNLGLIAAVNGYDGREDVRFASYASWAIRRSICRALSSKSRLIRLPVRLAEQASAVRRAEQDLTQLLGRRPSTREVALASGVDTDAVEELQRARENLVSLSEPVGEEEDVTLADLIRDDDHDPAGTVTETDERASVRGAWAALAPRSRRVLELRYGIDGHEPRTLAEVAAELGVSAERARVLEAKALRELAARPELTRLRVAA